MLVFPEVIGKVSCYVKGCPIFSPDNYFLLKIFKLNYPCSIFFNKIFIFEELYDPINVTIPYEFALPDKFIVLNVYCFEGLLYSFQSGLIF